MKQFVLLKFDTLTLLKCLYYLFVQHQSSASAPTSSNQSHNSFRPSLDEYILDRKQLIKSQFDSSFENDVILNYREKLANKIIMQLKSNEIQNGFKHPYNFTPSQHLFDVMKKIEDSKLYQIIQQMPKGGVLHAHATSICDPDCIIRFTYYDHLWQCNHTYKGIILFRFKVEKPTKFPTNGDVCVWSLVTDERQKVGAELYDRTIRSLFTLATERPKDIYKDINKVWRKFSNILDLSRSIVTYAPVWKEYYKQALRNYYADGVQYLEVRGGSINEVHHLNGSKLTPYDAVELYVDALNEYKIENPDFFGAKFIYCPYRLVSDEKIVDYIKTIRKLHIKFPKYFAGYDFAGQEDLGRRLIDFVPYVLSLPSNIPSYFHAGETKWFGETDENLIDAILLGTSRIGHGFSLNKYPKLLDMIIQKNIVVEMNPVSNQVLTLVDDYRNHPGSLFFSLNIPLIISSDNYPMWEVSPMSHDYYMTFLGIASSHSDLRTLKKLVKNSLQYSALDEDDKKVALKRWNRKWYEFIEDVILAHANLL